ncbi:uncharacterized protein Z520_00650 [Fonsecaea multimorphosa CBS 102226]|uniref:Tat pathway signal sequence n=1 Tax=Fonsecaea multimorphosa CBS 102226 TaxID=1442371 RepID=A0A0D2KCW5_9EURO|nr:uncharacterized protein Z520_00650 [Fonsecaea multimorphosa CBS 102226]KIY03958.1 hypothetical protein Z520_00650 [Fonsecaea multimorphosa CBS 102226]
MFEHDWSWPRAARYYTYRYNLLDADKEEIFDAGQSDDVRKPSTNFCRRPSIALNFLLAILVAAACGLCFYGGTLYGERSTKGYNEDLRKSLRLRNVEIQLEYNASFGDAPNTVTEAAWDSLLPVQGGFFQHPEIATARSDFAVFHQLHCLNGIRQAYWFTHDAMVTGRRLSDAEFPDMISSRHISHCIDLLRQALMCQPDLTVEVKDERGGVTGFGTVHQCKDWQQLMGWMAEWESYGQTEPYDPGKHNHHGHHSLVGG